MGIKTQIAEEKQVAKDYQPESLDKETIRKSQQGDELKNEAEHEEVRKESCSSYTIFFLSSIQLKIYLLYLYSCLRDQKRVKQVRTLKNRS